MSPAIELLENLSSRKRALLEERLLKKAAFTTVRSPALPTAEQGPQPLSFAQESVWFFDQFEPNSPLYNIPCSFRMRGPLDVGAFENALRAIVDRHETLRANFLSFEGKPLQTIAKIFRFEMPLIDLSALPEAEQKSETERRIRAEARRPFVLARDLKIRTTLLRLSREEHVWLLTLHHIAADAWSLRVLFQELETLYEAFRLGQPSPLPDPPMRYGDFVRSQRERFQGESAVRQIAHWKEHLTGEWAPLDLPADRSRPSRPTFVGDLHDIRLPRELLHTLKKLSREQGVTLNITLLAAFQALLHRYSGRETILVGSPFGIRQDSNAEKLIGLVMNTVILRADFQEGMTFLDLLQQVRANVLGALANLDTPLERILEELKLSRDASGNPAFQVLFQFLPTSSEPPRLSGLIVESVSWGAETSKFDLTFTLLEDADGLGGEIEYSTDMFDRTTIIRILGHYRTLLEAVVANPAEKISLLPLLSETEKHQLLHDWNDTAAPLHEDETIAGLFERQAIATPDAIALICENEILTYSELNRRANGIAGELRKLGVSPEILAGLFVERSVEMVAGLLGILKAGGAYVPLDPAYPKERLAHMIDDARLPVILTQEKLATQLPLSSATIVTFEKISNAPEAVFNNFSNSGRGRNTAYVIYTSGSTGKPKGVQIEHRSVVNLLASIAKTTRFRPDDKLLAVTTFSFDIAALEIFLPLTTGATLTLAGAETVSDGLRLKTLVESSRATVMQATPVTWRLLIEAGWRGNKNLKIFCGGEALSRPLADELLQRAGEVWNLYGPTETTIWSTAAKVEPGGEAVSIGRPLANTQLYILDKQLQPLPIGAVGELHIGGDGLARGYLNRPELTTEKFISNPFDPIKNRLYKTGDRARYRPDGTIECLGRMDHQVKIRGFRIEPGEIESVLLQQPNVREAVVTVREEASGEKRLAAYIVPREKSSPEIRELRARLKERLPEYMIPAAFVVLKALPLTPNGKINRKALPAPEFQSETPFIAPRSSLEQKLAQMWREILGVKQAGIHDDFFELGGHSLLATQVVSRVRNLTQMEISLRGFFETPTIAGLSALIEKSKPAAIVPAIVPLARKAAPG